MSDAAQPKKVITEPGIYYDCSFDDYVQISAINNSCLKILRKNTPMHAHYYQQHGFQTQCLTFGRLHHKLLLEPEGFDKEYAVGPNVRRNSNVWKEFEAQANEDGKEAIKREQYDEANHFVTAVKKQPVAYWIRQGRAEITLVWRDEEDVDVDVYSPSGEYVTTRHFPATGLLQKARLDYAREGDDILVDIKGVENASPDERRGFPAAAKRYGYYQQGAMSSHGWEALMGRTPAFCFVVIEKCPGKADPVFWPFPSAAYEMQPLAISVGMLDYRQALQTYAECLKNNEWPGYMTDKVLGLTPPAWAFGG